MGGLQHNCDREVIGDFEDFMYPFLRFLSMNSFRAFSSAGESKYIRKSLGMKLGVKSIA